MDQKAQNIDLGGLRAEDKKGQVLGKNEGGCEKCRHGARAECAANPVAGWDHDKISQQRQEVGSQQVYSHARAYRKEQRSSQQQNIYIVIHIHTHTHTYISSALYPP